METRNEIVKINASDYGLDETKAAEITKGLSSIIAEREILKKEYNKCILLEITLENIPLFKDLRLRIRDNRTKGIEIWHKNNKAYFLAGGQFVDAIRRKEAGENEYMEEKLLDGEKFIENQEKERIEKLRTERENLLRTYTEIMPLALGPMEQSVFDNYLAGVKLAYEARIAAEKKAEEDRIAKEKADAEAREAQRLENIKLKEEAIERERLAEIERNKQAKIFAAERAKAEAEKKERERLEAEIEKKRQADAKEKREAELKIENERKAQIAAEKKAAKAPDKIKLSALANVIGKIEMPVVKSDEAKEIVNNTLILLQKVVTYLNEKTEKL